MIENLITFSDKNYFFKEIYLYNFFINHNTKFIFWKVYAIGYAYNFSYINNQIQIKLFSRDYIENNQLLNFKKCINKKEYFCKHSSYLININKIINFFKYEINILCF